MNSDDNNLLNYLLLELMPVVGFQGVTHQFIGSKCSSVTLHYQICSWVSQLSPSTLAPVLPPDNRFGPRGAVCRVRGSGSI